MRVTRTVHKRRHRKTISLNDSELAALERYCTKYGIKNQTAMMRETIFKEVFDKFQTDYPTLWSARELAALEQF
ncbi:MAG: hypothetical protein ACOX0M_09565 [Salinivirgaceae bacterium]|jgi:hypothetical protein|nr:hypothetical protein [Bacteroidales bacterium]